MSNYSLSYNDSWGAEKYEAGIKQGTVLTLLKQIKAGELSVPKAAFYADMSEDAFRRTVETLFPGEVLS